MTIIVILSVLILGAVLCVYEIPRMLKSKSYRDLWAFSILLALGIILTILKSFHVSITNPSDWVAWMFSPVSDFLRHNLK